MRSCFTRRELPAYSVATILSYRTLSSMSASTPLDFFFFLAEDGIRYHCVTGVQTCALPIYRLADDDAAEDVADRPVRGAPHLLQAELLDPRLVRCDRGALDPDAVLLDRVRRVDGD